MGRVSALAQTLVRLQVVIRLQPLQALIRMVWAEALEQADD